jgi:hypothetical protein
MTGRSTPEGVKSILERWPPPPKGYKIVSLIIN